MKLEESVTEIKVDYRDLATAGNWKQSVDMYPGGTRYIKKVGMLVENFEIDP